MGFFENLAGGFAVAISLSNLFYCAIGAILGTAIGVLPGLGPPATIALLLPVTLKMEPVSAVIMLAGIFCGAMYGGSTTSILLNIPGEAASVVTCLDGYKMARKGRAGAALGISAIGSFIAGSLAVLGISVMAPTLASFALKFGPPEYFCLVFLGLMMAIYLSEESVLKGLMMGALGLLLGTVGLDPVDGTHAVHPGRGRLTDGVDFVVMAMGMFGVAEILCNLENVGKPGGLQDGAQGDAPHPPRTGGDAGPRCSGVRYSVSSSACCPAAGRSSAPLPPMPWRSVSPNIPRSSARERSRA